MVSSGETSQQNGPQQAADEGDKPMHAASTGPGRRSTAQRRTVFAMTALAGLISQAYAQQAAPAAPATSETITVTGYRGSLAQSALAKREAIGLSETIVAEEMGKFPDANIAESLARMPGVTVGREITGEGLTIQIRGLGSSFTRVLLNGAPVASASTGRTDAQSANREVDLDFLPTELFTKLTVSKSPTASMTEGGAAGIVDMRTARPFDKRGTRGSFNIAAVKNEPADKWGNKGSAIGSMTFGDTFGVLAGVAWSQNRVRTTGFESIGWTNAGLTAAQRTSGTLNSTGGGNWTIPAAVPNNAATGVPAAQAALLTPGATVNEALLLQLNPGANIGQIDNALIPRLGREMVAEGNRDRVNGILSLEWRPTDDLDFYLDSMVGKKHNKIERSDMNWVGRFGSMIPVNLEFDRADCSSGCVVTKGVFANAQWFLEYRPYEEKTEFIGANPGFEWRVSDRLTLDGQANFTKSEFHRESPTVLLITPGSSGFTVNYDNSSGTPVIGSNRSLNDPANFGWPGGRVNVQEEKREAETKGLRFNLTWGDRNFGIKAGGAYDDVYRRISSLNNDAAWQNAVCGNNLNVHLPAPNTTNPGGCNGANTPSAATTYPGYGSGYTAGQTTPIAFTGSLIPNAAVGNYLTPNSRGWVALDWNRFRTDSQYDRFSDSATAGTGSTNTGTNPGYIQEKVKSFYVETNGRVNVLGNLLRYNAGVRQVETEQTFGTLISTADPRNAAQNGQPALADGARFPNIITEELSTTRYSNTLPSVSLAYNLAPPVVSRISASRSMTRPNPQDLRRTQLQFSDPSAGQGTLTNSELKPYVSDNLDLGLEWYTGREGYLAMSLFKKDIQAFTAAQNTVQTFGSLNQYAVNFQSITQQQRDALAQRSGLPSGLTTLTPAQQALVDAQNVVITQQVNSPALLKVKGLELTWQQPLSFLPIPGFGFSANYTFINQKATNNSGFIATGVPEYTSNLTAYYEQGGFMFRVSRTFSKGSQQTNSPQNGITAAQLYGDDYAQVDIAARVDLHKLLGWKQELQLTLDVWNATREKQRSYFQFPNATFTEYTPGATFLLGLRAAF
jgi:TonB-dependent receptor